MAPKSALAKQSETMRLLVDVGSKLSNGPNGSDTLKKRYSASCVMKSNRMHRLYPCRKKRSANGPIQTVPNIADIVAAKPSHAEVLSFNCGRSPGRLPLQQLKTPPTTPPATATRMKEPFVAAFLESAINSDSVGGGASVCAAADALGGSVGACGIRSHIERARAAEDACKMSRVRVRVRFRFRFRVRVRVRSPSPPL